MPASMWKSGQQSERIEDTNNEIDNMQFLLQTDRCCVPGNVRTGITRVGGRGARLPVY